MVGLAGGRPRRWCHDAIGSGGAFGACAWGGEHDRGAASSAGLIVRYISVLVGERSLERLCCEVFELGVWGLERWPCECTAICRKP